MYKKFAEKGIKKDSSNPLKSAKLYKNSVALMAFKINALWKYWNKYPHVTNPPILRPTKLYYKQRAILSQIKVRHLERSRGILVERIKAGILLITLCILGYGIIWGSSLSILVYVNALFFEGDFGKAQLIYANIGVLLLIVLIQWLVLHKLRREPVYSD